MLGVNKCKVILIYTPCAAAIIGSLMNLSNKMTYVAAMKSVTILYLWVKVHPLKLNPPFSAEMTHILLSGNSSDGLFRPTDHTKFLILRFITDRRGVVFSDMVGWSLTFLVVFYFLSFPDFLPSFSVSCFLSAPALLDAVVAVAVVPSMA